VSGVTVTLDADALVAALAGLTDEQLRPLADRLAPLVGVEPPRPVSPWMTPEEAAEYLRTTRKAIYSRLDSGQFTRNGTPGRVLLARSEVEEHALGGRRNPPSRVRHVLTNPRQPVKNADG